MWFRLGSAVRGKGCDGFCDADLVAKVEGLL
jgi:hypothetical protein